MALESGIRDSAELVTGHGYALFDTAIGRCGIAWSGRGVAGVQLPSARESETRARMRRRFPDARESTPPSEGQRALDDIVALLRGEPRALGDVALDLEGVPPFHCRVYELARTIPLGQTLSYGEIAARAGVPGLARAVGQALGQNPFAIVVPCHRVVAADGKVGGFSASGGVRTKLRLLSIEGARASRQLGLFQDDAAFGFHPTAAVGRESLTRPVHTHLPRPQSILLSHHRLS